MNEQTYVTATYSGILHIDQDIVRINDFGDWSFLKFDLFDALKDEGEVLDVVRVDGCMYGCMYVCRSVSHLPWFPRETCCSYSFPVVTNKSINKWCS